MSEKEDDCRLHASGIRPKKRYEGPVEPGSTGDGLEQKPCHNASGYYRCYFNDIQERSVSLPSTVLDISTETWTEVLKSGHREPAIRVGG